jgi:hypothetical protein
MNPKVANKKLISEITISNISDFELLFPLRKGIGTTQTPLLYKANGSFNGYSDTLIKELSSGNESTYTTRNSIADNIHDTSPIGITSNDEILVRIDNKIKTLDISNIKAMDNYNFIYYNNSVNTKYIIVEIMDDVNYYYRLFEIESQDESIAVYVDLNFTVVVKSLEEDIRYVDILEDKFYIITYETVSQDYNITTYNLEPRAYRRNNSSSYDLNMDYIKLLDSGEFIYYDSIYQTLNILSDINNQNSIYIPDLPKLDNSDYSIYITRSGIVLYYTNGTVYMVDIKYPSFDGDISNIEYFNGIKEDYSDIDQYSRHFTFIYTNSDFYTKIGQFISDGGHFITNHYLDYDYDGLDSNGDGYNYTSVYDTDIVLDEESLLPIHKSYIGEDILLNRALLRPSDKYTIFINAPDYSGLELIMNFIVDSTTYSFDVDTSSGDMGNKIFNVDLSLELINNNFNISDLESIKYIEFYPESADSVSNIELRIFD